MIKIHKLTQIRNQKELTSNQNIAEISSQIITDELDFFSESPQLFIATQYPFQHRSEQVD